MERIAAWELVARALYELGFALVPFGDERTRAARVDAARTMVFPEYAPGHRAFAAAAAAAAQRTLSPRRELATASAAHDATVRDLRRCFKREAAAPLLRALVAIAAARVRARGGGGGDGAEAAALARATHLEAGLAPLVEARAAGSAASVAPPELRVRRVAAAAPRLPRVA